MALAVHDWLEAYRKAWEEADAQAAAELFTDDAEYRDNIYQEPHRGREGVKAYWSGVTAAQTDVSVVMGQPFVDGNRAAAEFWTRMSVGGNPVTLAGCLLVEFDDEGLCRHLREYYEFAEESMELPAVWGT